MSTDSSSPSQPDAPHLPLAQKHAILRVLGVGMAVGLLGSAAGVFFTPDQFASSWLWAFFCYFPLASGAIYWILLHYICDSNWSVVPRRVFENMALTMFALMFVFAIVAGVPALRDHLWLFFTPESHSEAAYQAKANYLSAYRFYGMAAVYFIFFISVAHSYWRHSTWQDHTGSPVHWYRLRNRCYFLMVVWAVLQTLANIDWLMGLDFHWSSSLFGVYTFAFSAQGSLAAGIVLLGLLRYLGHLEFLNAEHFQLLGKLLFGFTIFWGYIAFGQYLLIWYANIPEETIFYNDHNHGTWVFLTWLLIVGKFIFPVVALLAQETKRNFTVLVGISLWVVLMHFVEMYWLIVPYRDAATIVPHWQDLAAWLAVTSFVGLVYISNTASSALYPVRDPRLKDCLEITN